MSVNIKKTGTIYTSGQFINENIVSGTVDFLGWSINALYTSSVDPDGFTVLSASRSGLTSNSWARITSPQIPIEVSNNGLVVSFMFKCDDYSAYDHLCACSINCYIPSGTRIGWNEPTLTNTTQCLHEDFVDGKWIKVVYHFSSTNVRMHNGNANYGAEDVTYNTITFNLVKNGSIHFKKIKIELGTSLNQATPWCLNSEDWGYVGNINGFIEDGNMMKMYKSHIQATEFIEW